MCGLIGEANVFIKAVWCIFIMSCDKARQNKKMIRVYKHSVWPAPFLCLGWLKWENCVEIFYGEKLFYLSWKCVGCNHLLQIVPLYGSDAVFLGRNKIGIINSTGEFC